MEKEKILTTTDNPYSPFTKWDDWYNWDVRHGYDTCGYIARLTRTYRTLSEKDNDRLYYQAAQTIIDQNGSEIYRLVDEDSKFEIS